MCVATAKAEQLVATARRSLPAADASVAREAIGWDLALLAEIDRQLDQAAHQLERVLPSTPFQILTTTPATIRAAGYGGALGDPARWPTASQVYRASGLTPIVNESSGHRVDGEISREARGKQSMVIWTALANRANRIAFAMVRDQTVYDPSCWR